MEVKKHTTENLMCVIGSFITPSGYTFFEITTQKPANGDDYIVKDTHNKEEDVYVMEVSLRGMFGY